MTDTTINATPGYPSPPPPNPLGDRDATGLPPNLAKVLRVVQILLAYGRHLAATFERRSTSPGFHIIARAFGTGKPAVILAHIRRGILRAAALERLLLDRAARGRDLTLPPVRVRSKPDEPPTAADPATDPAAKPGPAARVRNPRPRPSWRDDWLDGAADPLDPRHQPSFEQLLARARRRPIGRTIGDICADLGIAAELCLGSFWNELFFTMMHYDGSPALYLLRRWRREQSFDQEQDRVGTLDRSWPKIEMGPGRGHIVKVLGFFIGQDPVEPRVIGPAADAPLAQRASSAPAGLRPQSPWVTPPSRRAGDAPPAPAATGPP